MTLNKSIDFNFLSGLGLYREDESGAKHLVGHVPIELSCLLTNFLNSNPENKILATVIGKRKREIGLVVPAKFGAKTNIKKIANISK